MSKLFEQDNDEDVVDVRDLMFLLLDDDDGTMLLLPGELDRMHCSMLLKRVESVFKCCCCCCCGVGFSSDDDKCGGDDSDELDDDPVEDKENFFLFAFVISLAESFLLDVVKKEEALLSPRLREASPFGLDSC
jgi:hypothetical protein